MLSLLVCGLLKGKADSLSIFGANLIDRNGSLSRVVKLYALIWFPKAVGTLENRVTLSSE